MLNSSIFEYKDYKKFINDWMKQAPNEGRGLRTQLADAIGCQTAFITHVLSGNNHLSLEQSEACARWMNLKETETDFFLLLVMYNRAGTKSLEKHFEKQISQKRDSQAILKERVKIKETLSYENQQVYYSHWLYGAVHMALLIPQLQTMEGLQKYFKVSSARLMSVIDFLIENGLIKQEKGFLKVSKPVLHLEQRSPFISNHHTNWRLKSIDAVSVANSESLHYSSVISLSNEDYIWVREKLSHLLEQLVGRIKDSKDEKLASLCFDWFEI